MIAGAGPQVGAGRGRREGGSAPPPPVGNFARAESDVSVLGAGSGWSILSPFGARQMRRQGGRIAVPAGAHFGTLNEAADGGRPVLAMAFEGGRSSAGGAMADLRCVLCSPVSSCRRSRLLFP
jgi:hypothetical protein